MQEIISQNPEIIVITLLILVVTCITLLILFLKINKRLHKMLLGKNAENLEDSFNKLAEDLYELTGAHNTTKQHLASVENRLRKSIQSIETVRFNPFKGTGSGGNQSFSTAFINEHGNGVILTSMYTRDRISMFAKPIESFASEFELTEEENEVLNASKNTVGQIK
jgi:hypothetical protein